MNHDPSRERRSLARRVFSASAYWLQLLVQPMIAVLFVVGLAWLFGYLQRTQGWFSDTAVTAETSEEKDAQYACSMLCVFVNAPGRCPVCGMELQEIETTGDPKDLYGLTIEPTARRLANIETVAALPEMASKSIEVLGRVEYDETSLASVSSYVDGRIEELFVDFTGARVGKGDELAVVYSPSLYSDQVALFQAKEAASKISGIARVDRANARLYESARRRLIEKGVPESHLNEIVANGTPSRRIKINSPLAGTVVEKRVSEGDYITTGKNILRIADLSTVWFMLEVYPEQASRLVLGQSAKVECQVSVGAPFDGRISFIEPDVDPSTRTVGVRVSVPNEAGLLKVGDLGKATISLAGTGRYANVIVPRSAILVNGSHSVAYVETEPGRFEFRQVAIAETLGDRISLSGGIEPGEQVVASGTFMLDSTFNIQGKASLIDPKRASPGKEPPRGIGQGDSSNTEQDEELPQMALPDEDLPQMELPEMNSYSLDADVTGKDAREEDLLQMAAPGGEELPEMELPQMEAPR